MNERVVGGVLPNQDVSFCDRELIEEERRSADVCPERERCLGRELRRLPLARRDRRDRPFARTQVQPEPQQRVLTRLLDYMDMQLSSVNQPQLVTIHDSME